MTSTRLRTLTARQLSHSGHQRARVDRAAGPRRAGRSSRARRAPGPPPRASCRARVAMTTASGSACCKRGGQAAGGQQVGHLGAQLGWRRRAAARPADRAPPPRRGGRRRSAVTVSIACATVWPRLSTWRRPPSRSSAATIRSLVRAHAVMISGVGRIGARAHPLPQLAAGDQRGLDHLGVAGGHLGRGQAWPACRCRTITALGWWKAPT